MRRGCEGLSPWRRGLNGLVVAGDGGFGAGSSRFLDGVILNFEMDRRLLKQLLMPSDPAIAGRIPGIDAVVV